MRLSRPGTSCSRTRRSRIRARTTFSMYPGPPRAQAVDAKTVRVGSPLPLLRWRELFRRRPAAARAPGRGTRGSGRRIDNPKTARPIGSGAFPRRALGAWRGARSVRNSRYWEGHPAYLDRLVVRFCESDPLAGGARAGAAQRDRLHPLPNPGRRIGDSPATRLAHPCRGPAPAMEHLLFRVGPGGHPALELEARPPGPRLRHRPWSRSRAQSRRTPIRPRAGRSTARRSCRRRSSYLGRVGRAIATTPERAQRLLRAGRAAGAGPTRSTPARASG